MKGVKLMKKRFALIATIVTVVATLFAGSFASWFWAYQPETPSCLK
jgi:cyclic lactone autoinducer peptide